MKSYQKLKLRVKELESDLNEVVINPTSYKSIEIRAKIKMNNQLAESILYGERKPFIMNGYRACVLVNPDIIKHTFPCTQSE